MKFEQKLKKLDSGGNLAGVLRIFGFIYRRVYADQNRLMQEQIMLWGKSALGQRFLHGREITNH